MELQRLAFALLALDLALAQSFFITFIFFLKWECLFCVIVYWKTEAHNKKNDLSLRTTLVLSQTLRAFKVGLNAFCVKGWP